MSTLKPGTRCVIVAGCPENIVLIVEVVRHLGRCEAREDAYLVKTLSGRNLNQLWQGKKLIRGYSRSCITDRHKLRPLVDPNDEFDSENEKVPVTVDDGRKVTV